MPHYIQNIYEVRKQHFIFTINATVNYAWLVKTKKSDFHNLTFYGMLNHSCGFYEVPRGMHTI